MLIFVQVCKTIDKNLCVFDRNMNNEVGLEIGPKPRVSKVYNRKKTKTAKEGDVAK